MVSYEEGACLSSAYLAVKKREMRKITSSHCTISYIVMIKNLSKTVKFCNMLEYCLFQLSVTVHLTYSQLLSIHIVIQELLTKF